MSSAGTIRPIVAMRFWLQWVLVSAVGMLVAFLVGFLLIGTLVGTLYGQTPDEVMQPESPAFFLGLTLLFTATGAGIGCAQWLVLRRHIDGAGWWVLGSTLGFAVVAGLFGALSGVVSEEVNEVVHNAAGGGVAGIIQYLVLRRHAARAAWWLPASIIGFLVAGAVSGLLGGGPVGMVTGIASMAGITAVVLIWMFRHSSAESSAAA